MKVERKRLNELAKSLTTGGRPKGGATTNGVPSLGAEHLNGNGGFIFTNMKFVPDEFFTGLKNGHINLSDILIVKDGATTGKVSFVGSNFPFVKAAINEHLFQLRLDETLCFPKYAFYYLSSPHGQRQLLSDFRGATVGGISRGILDCVDIPLPPLSIQRQIADTLDKADALRQKDQQLLQKYDELAQSIFYEMFGDPVRNERGWREHKLIEVCVQITDGTHFSPPSVSMGVPYITAKHLKITGVDFYADPTYVSEEDHQEIYSRCKPIKGDILYIKDGATTGIAAVNEYDFPFSMLSSLALIKPKTTVLNNQYLRYWLNNSQVKEMYLREYMAGAAIKRFTLQKIKQFKIAVPPIKLQREFGQLVEKLSEIRKVKEQSFARSCDLFTSLLNQNFS